jgi:membrane protease YdiL (CAAX protease family)
MLTSAEGTVVVLIVVSYFLWGQHILAAARRISLPRVARLRRHAYYGTVVLQWVMVGLVALVEGERGDTARRLGLGVPNWLAFWICTVGACVAIVLLLRWRQRVLKRPASNESIRALTERPGAGRLLPQSRTEHAAFLIMGLSSAFTEELLFRGYFLAVFTLWMPLWTSAVAATGLFALGHLYQKVGGALQAAVLGAVFCAFYLLTASLIIPVVLHALVNWHQASAVKGALDSKQGHAGAATGSGGS